MKSYLRTYELFWNFPLKILGYRPVDHEYLRPWKVKLWLLVVLWVVNAGPELPSVTGDVILGERDGCMGGRGQKPKTTCHLEVSKFPLSLPERHRPADTLVLDFSDFQSS